MTEPPENMPETLPKPASKPELRLVIWPDVALKDPVAPFPTSELSTRLVRDTAGAMIRAMYTHYGVGLAAQQVGIPFQIFVMDANWNDESTSKKPRVFLNPKIVEAGEGAIELPQPGEGCLSFPYGYRNPVRRLDKVELEYQDFKGEVHHEWFEGHESIIVQHEMDHLMGFCFIDRLSSLKKDMAIRRARKVRRRYKKGYEKMLKSLKNAPRTKEYALKMAKNHEQKIREANAQ